MLSAALTILVSSFLLFLVQPIVAKQILPWFGGSAGVWMVCLVFFQCVLLLGYAYAHWITRRAGARQFMVHISLLVVSCLTLPIIPGIIWKGALGVAPEYQILGLLAATVGLPYFLLASTSPLLQRWLSGGTGNPVKEHSIYRLFALSNFGSLVGLFSYPVAIEPFVSLRTQAWVWSGGYLLFVACCVYFALQCRRSAIAGRAPAAGELGTQARPKRTRYAYWVACAALGSALLLAGTSQITQNVASIPLLWIAPLGLYLLSFVACFEGRGGRGWYQRQMLLVPVMLTTGAMAWALFANIGTLSVYVALPIFLLGVFAGCLLCNGELARSKPGSSYLTHFYLSISIGGALGSVLVGIVAPQVFNGYWEMPLVIVCLTLLGVYCGFDQSRGRDATSWTRNVLVALAISTLILLLLSAFPIALGSYAAELGKVVQGEARWGCAALLVVVAVLLQRYGLARAVGLTAFFCALAMSASYYRAISKDSEFLGRNFYGALSVVITGEDSLRIRSVAGVIEHGTQLAGSPGRFEPTTYYGESSGIGRAIRARQKLGPLRIGSVGLGAGTLAAYGRSGDLLRVYELNPMVMDVAQAHFTYLKDSKAAVELVLGDARLSLEREIAAGDFAALGQRFDILSIDAFSGDAIPLHLLTREAFAIYAQVTKPDGVIALHLSNLYLDLPPVVLQLARDAGFQAILVSDRPSDPFTTSYASDWVLVSRNTTLLLQPELATNSSPIVVRSGQPVWSDQFSNLLRVLK